MIRACRRMPLAPAAMFAGMLASTTSAAAEETIGGFTFPDGAFADFLEEATPSAGMAFSAEGLDEDGLHSEILELPGDFAVLESLLVGSDLLNWAGIQDSTATLRLGFFVPHPVDGPGDDLVLFDIGFREEIAISIGDVTQTYTFLDTGEDIVAGNHMRDLNYAAIDLADFGVTTASRVVLAAVSGGEFDADVTALGAVNVDDDVVGVPGSPVPATASLTVWPVPYRAGPLGIRLRTSAVGDAPFDVSIYDLQGRRAGPTTRGRLVGGAGELRWDGRTFDGKPLSDGVYFLRVTTPTATHTQKIVVSR